MPSSYEQAPLVPSAQNTESLIFSSPQEAGDFRQRVEGALEAEKKRRMGLDERREVVGEQVAAEFAREGEAVDVIKEPWEHTQEEHAEVQELVNLAYAQDLAAALKKARSSPNYPRNVDLLHDVLTSQMYEGLVAAGINKQPVAGWIVGLVVLVLMVAGLVGLLLMAG